MEKICNTCKLPNQASEYYPDKRNKDGLGAICRKCRREKRKGKHKYYPTTKQYQANKMAAACKEISDYYVIQSIVRGTTLCHADIKPHKELIEAKRLIIKIQRTIKNDRKKHQATARGLA